MDTVDAGGRVYHVNCFEEVSRGSGGGGSGVAATPSTTGTTTTGVLGKRKAVDEGASDGLEGLRAKLRV